MSIRGCLFTLSFLALTGNTKYLFAQTVALEVQVYDYAGLNPAALHEFMTHTRQILTNSGVAVEVDLCGVVSATCEGLNGSSRHVVIRVIPTGSATNGRKLRWKPLGQSIADRDGGTYASVFLQPAEEKASEVNLSPIDVLSYAATHEVGHLLLGDQAHTARGLMKAHWEAGDFQAMAQNRLYFVPEQARALRMRYGIARRAKTSSSSPRCNRTRTQHAIISPPWPRRAWGSCASATVSAASQNCEAV
jgi:hypothetical protein